METIVALFQREVGDLKNFPLTPSQEFIAIKGGLFNS